MLSAALLNAMAPSSLSRAVTRVIRHRDWTPRKSDVKQDLDWWREAIRIAKKNKGDKAKTREKITEFVEKHNRGRL